MQIVAAPSRVFQTWSMRLLIATGVFDLAVVLLKSLTDLHIIGAETALTINAVMMFVTGVVRLIAQNIPVTSDQKTALIEAAAATPMKPGESNVAVKIDGVRVPATN